MRKFLSRIKERCWPRSPRQWAAAAGPFAVLGLYLYLQHSRRPDLLSGSTPATILYLLLNILFAPASILYCELGGKFGWGEGEPFLSSNRLYAICLFLYTLLLALAASYTQWCGAADDPKKPPTKRSRLAIQINVVMLSMILLILLFVAEQMHPWGRALYMKAAATYPKEWAEAKLGLSRDEASARMGKPVAISLLDRTDRWLTNEHGVRMHLELWYEKDGTTARLVKWKEYGGARADEAIAYIEGWKPRPPKD